MLKILLAAVAGMILGMLVIGLSLHAPKAAQEAPQAVVCPHGLAEQAAKKDAEYKKEQAEFEALKRGAK